MSPKLSNNIPVKQLRRKDSLNEPNWVQNCWNLAQEQYNNTEVSAF